MAQVHRDRTFTIFAVLFTVLAVSNLLKPFQLLGAQTGFVLFGQRLTGMANSIAGPLFGLYLLVYAYGIWQKKRFALPLGHAYATYVVLNILLFMGRNENTPGLGYLIFGLVYSVVAIGVSCGAAYVLTKRKAELS
jgi:hypothetical protein